MMSFSPAERDADRRSMARRAVAGLSVLAHRRPLQVEDLRRTLEGYLTARYFKVHRKGGFHLEGHAQEVLLLAQSWQAYLEDAEEGQQLPPALKELGVLAELAASARVFLHALESASHVDARQAQVLRKALERQPPVALPRLLSGLAQALRGIG